MIMIDSASRAAVLGSVAWLAKRLKAIGEVVDAQPVVEGGAPAGAQRAAVLGAVTADVIDRRFVRGTAARTGPPVVVEHHVALAMAAPQPLSAALRPVPFEAEAVALQLPASLAGCEHKDGFHQAASARR